MKDDPPECGRDDFSSPPFFVTESGVYNGLRVDVRIEIRVHDVVVATDC